MSKSKFAGALLLPALFFATTAHAQASQQPTVIAVVADKACVSKTVGYTTSRTVCNRSSLKSTYVGNAAFDPETSQATISDRVAQLCAVTYDNCRLVQAKWSDTFVVPKYVGVSVKDGQYTYQLSISGSQPVAHGTLTLVATKATSSGTYPMAFSAPVMVDDQGRSYISESETPWVFKARKSKRRQSANILSGSGLQDADGALVTTVEGAKWDRGSKRLYLTLAGE